MKKRFLIFFLMILLFKPLNVMASNKIYDINIDVYLDEEGNANITEKWHVDGSDGTEWYKVMNNLGNMELTDFKVSMDGKDLIYKNWNVNESLTAKRGYYGINYTSSGLELCFGKYDYNEHTFILNYNLSNFVFNTDDSQAIYYNFIDTLSNVDFRNFTLNIKSYYSFPDTLDVWGYGYKGYAYVKDGIISMSNEGDMDENYVVLLAKFPLDTFKTENRYSQFNTFDSILNRAEEGTFEYNYEENNPSIIERIINFMIGASQVLIWVGLPIILIKSQKQYGYKNNKKIDQKDTPMFRDIPCNKDIYYANALIKLNNFNYKESNILGAIILKWTREDKIGFKQEDKKGILSKEKSVIDLTRNPVFNNELEKKLFDIMYKASEDGYLESKELEKWCRRNYNEFFNLFKKLVDNKIKELETNGHIYKRVDRSECKKNHVMDDMIYDDSVKLYGLKKYLTEFSQMNTKEVMDVKLWDEYLMFAYLFGIADKVAAQLKNMYPEVLTQETDMIDYNTIMLINSISNRSVSAANSARNAASSYSGGGGGFSSGGGGGGSFGGGGGGSR